MLALTFLDLADNRVTFNHSSLSLPELTLWLARLVPASVQTLLLHDNLLDSGWRIGESFVGRNLVTLSLGGNRIRNLPGDLWLYTALRSLNVSFNLLNGRYFVLG